MKMQRRIATSWVCLVFLLVACVACSTADEDAADREGTDDDDGGSSLFDGDDVGPADFSGVWTGSMDIHPYSGEGGGVALIELVIDVADDGTFTGTFSDASCPDDPAETVTGALNLDAVTIAFSFIFACGADGIIYDYRMLGEILAVDEMAGDFDAFDDIGTPLSQGTWTLTN